MATITTEHPVPATARERMTRALAGRGITAHHDDDAGNSWLLINLDGDDFPGIGTPHLVAYIYDSHEDWLSVDEPMEHCAGTWRVNFNDGRSEIPVFTGKRTTPAHETAECAAFITARITAALRA